MNSASNRHLSRTLAGAPASCKAGMAHSRSHGWLATPKPWHAASRPQRSAVATAEVRQFFLYLGVKFSVLGFSCTLMIFGITCISQTVSLKHVSHKMIRAKKLHGMYGNIKCLSKCRPCNWLTNKTSMFTPPLFRSLWLVNSFYKRCVCLSTIHPIY